MTQTPPRSTVVGVFHDADDAREAIEALKDEDFASDTSGRTLVTVRADGRYDEAQRILREHRAYDVESRAASAQTATATAASTATPSAAVASTRDANDHETLQLREEELQARKTSVETG